jgi:hypothetical protein
MSRQRDPAKSAAAPAARPRLVMGSERVSSEIGMCLGNVTAHADPAAVHLATLGGTRFPALP